MSSFYSSQWRYTRTYTPTKFDSLRKLFGGAIEDMKSSFLSLAEPDLEQLFSDYGQIYNASAERYARKTFPKWKTGETKLSGQTMERLVDLVPRYLTPELRFSILQKVLKKHKNRVNLWPPEDIRINTQDPAPGFAELERALANIRIEDPLAIIPDEIMEAAKWLYDDDMTVARAMLAKVELKRNEIMKSTALKEVALLKRTINSGQIQTANYSVKLPSGEISAEVFTPRRSFWEVLLGR